MNGGKIYKAIADAMAEISPVAKNNENTGQRFMYRGIDDIMNELHPILVKHRIFIRMETTDRKREERKTVKTDKYGNTAESSLMYSILTITYHFTADDGSSVPVTVVGEAMDSGDKSCNKAMAVAMKYACLQLFCIPTEDMADPDSETPPPSLPKKEGGKTPPANKTQKADGRAKPPADRRAEILKEMGKIMTAVNPGNLPYFSEIEKKTEKGIISKTENNSELEAQLSDMKTVLEKRIAAFKPVPFDDGFKDDIPGENQDSIF